MICSEKVLNVPVCKKCQKELFTLDNVINIPRCQCCGKELISTKNICMECREVQVLQHTDKVIPCFSYRLWNKQLLFMWKIEGVRSLSRFFADVVFKVICYEEVDFIVPIPPRPGKIRENGWDQIDEICKFLENFYSVKCLNLLERLSTKQQKKLDRLERLEAMETSYSLVDESKLEKEMSKSEKGKNIRIALIDDVCTTGSTLESCSKLLKSYGIKYIEAITLFTVD